MIKIKQITQFDEALYILFLDFCIKSKPYDFCSLKSSHLRNCKIKEYYYFLLNECFIIEASLDNKPIRYSFFSFNDEKLILEFTFYNYKKIKPSIAMSLMHETILFVMNNFNKKLISGTITRKHKLQKYINWLKRYDKIAEFIEIDGIMRIIWKYERFSKNSWNE